MWGQRHHNFIPGQTADAGEPFTFRWNGTEGAILPDNLSGTRTASGWPL
jgi:hypothetical protein